LIRTKRKTILFMPAEKVRLEPVSNLRGIQMDDQRQPPNQADETLSYDATPSGKLRSLLKRAELSQRGAARLLGIDERTMRMWCAGQGEPPASVFRALDPQLTYSEHLRQRIESNEQHIEVLESGRLHDLPRDYRPVDSESTRQEIEHLRRRNEAYSSILQLHRCFHEMQEAHAEVIKEWLTPGFGPSAESLRAFDAANQEFVNAKENVDRITQGMRPWWTKVPPKPPQGG
jgi:DNA-binding transcriptional regulator YiaG